MNPLHLLWIVPLSATVGAFVMGIIVGGNREEHWYDKTENRRLES
jgi:hypothetical protein